MSRLLAGKHAAIVGGTGAIGFPIARLFASHGARLTILSRSALSKEPQLRPSLVSFKGAGNPGTQAGESEHRFINLDVGDPADIKSKLRGKDPEREVGNVDLLVNCAGISQTTVMERTSPEKIRDIIGTNLTATMLACKFARMQRHGKTTPKASPPGCHSLLLGCIINVSSLMAEKAAVGAAAYTAAKAGVNGTSTFNS